MSEKPLKILIVGGGSAGWMAAAYLDAVLNRDDERRADVGLIESPDAPRIGVGEATIPSINHILAAIGIDEIDFLRHTDGTFKQAIKFDNWLDNKGEGYYHAFSRFTVKPLDNSGPRWLESDRAIPFMATVSAQPQLCEWQLAPRMLGDWNFGPKLTYAYHMNALKFADYLQSIATARGVRHYVDHMTDVELQENGDIASISTRGGKHLEADLFIDCTGFAALLIEKKLGVPWVDFSQWLLCDRALVMPVDYETWYPGGLRPYTLSTAVSAGWIWDIPLQNRRGVGYVHSSAFIDADAAERELRAYEGAHADGLDARIINFKVGMRETAWFRNCIAIGLSGGFLEPIESTGLYLSDLATVLLTEYFPDQADMPTIAYRYNRIIANRFYEVLDFINLHYCLTRRTDTEFWREVQKPEHITDRLAAKLEFWREKPVSLADFEDQYLPGQPTQAMPGSNGDNRFPIDTGKLFTRSSYEAILYGMDFQRDECRERYGPDLPRPTVDRQIIERVKAAPQKLPRHDAWFQQVLGMPQYGDGGQG